MIQFSDEELRRIQQSVEFAYDANETLMIAKKIEAYLAVKKLKQNKGQIYE